jgi:hypothetical protein
MRRDSYSPPAHIPDQNDKRAFSRPSISLISSSSGLCKGSGVGFRKSKVTSYACPAVKKQSIVRPLQRSIYIFFLLQRKKTVKQGRRSKESLMLGLSKLVAYRAMCLEAPLYHKIYMIYNPTLSSFSLDFSINAE